MKKFSSLVLASFLCTSLYPLLGYAESKVETHPDEIRVMSYNIWIGGEGGYRPLELTEKVIRETKADVVGLQEGTGRERPDGSKPNNAKKIAEALGWHYIGQENNKAILSRFEIVGVTPGRHGAEIKLPNGDTFHLFNVHLNHAPYQPYQLLEIEYEDAPFLKSEAELVAAAEEARGAELRETLAEIKPLVDAGKRVMLTGDFNEPSHLDWTVAAAGEGVVPMAVAYPASRAVIQAGLVDVYRNMHPDESAKPGFTWTPTTKIDDPTDRHDRIDFVYATPNIKVSKCEIVGESEAYAEIIVQPYPSDHRAVLAIVRIN